VFDHVGITVKDLAKSKAFYAAALKPLGLVQGTEFPGWTSFGPPGRSRFWIAQGSPSAAAPRMHLAFTADRSGVDAFYAAAMATGGTDNGAPGLRPHYHEHYYGAFVLDPDGYNIEAVCHEAPTRGSAKRPPPKKAAPKKGAPKKAAPKKAGKPKKKGR
jgi:catechol 2,3-dioxygenase-like lactoylglutathione lyase family enzyme